ncbi:GNAT family N-acetyltransferase [Natronobacterium gregoryi]|uniref:Acetyltransferase n=2 Tax=Natronobacterium gregoryi TaxID=44930 RepID=L0ALP1_NATGS|nr:N-acetyltransferase [Natronobacterium gregoryi]AFZ74813.1 acetyltransferase [Natronobacterium gregoryi SP2]ELY66146.1 GCN5-related N-acetyltransferase [Natronobacterium gregoryi SP2]PLK19479.1 N-acetyltransferase [Natronobacterium gregoryi SP2]SFJ43601.1 Ribosomal protein S18 acetylase RimI [Natronobacterium gregoryi]
MSVNIDSRVVVPGSDDYVDAAWQLKERISSQEGVLKQRHEFFTDAYRRSKVHCYVVNDDLVGFAAVRRDGYILFLAVAPEYRGEGIGKRLVARVADDHDSITCHARTSNENALQFYEHLGFEIKRRIDDYYEDGGDAYYLKLGSGVGIADRISDLIRR